jgi:hypothetical protein
MEEAREKLVEICQDLSPKDLVARDSIGTVIEDLGLNFKLKDQRLGFRGSRLSIKEKLSLSKRKVSDIKKFIIFVLEILVFLGFYVCLYLFIYF